MANKKMDICEIYPTIKSCGINAGKPVLCIRLFGTDFKDNRDDRRYAWEKNPDSMAVNRKRMEIGEVIKEIGSLKKMDEWEITGGEPLLQQDMLVKLIKEYKKAFKTKDLSIEIQTNGFIEPDKALDKLVDRYCLNAKLSNSLGGTPKSTFGRRVQETVWKWFVASPKAYFMFSLETESDVQEIIEMQRLFNIDSDRIHLRAFVVDVRGVMRGMTALWNACMTFGFNLSNRFDMSVHGKIKRGV